MLSENKLIIGNKEIPNLEKYNLILGNFQEQDLTSLENKSLIKLFDNLDSISISLFIESLDNNSGQFKDLKQVNKVLTLLNRNMKNIKKNSKLISDYNDFLTNFNNSFKLLLLNHRKERLVESLKIAEKYKKSSEELAIKDLIEKLRSSINLNSAKLKYLEKDYLERKNQLEKLKHQIELQNDQINKLNTQKKQCFRYINYITRDMEADIEKPEALGLDQIEINNDLSNAEKIRTLQIKAREIQYDSNKIKENVKHDKKNLESIRPQFELLENDYLQLKLQITQDQQKISEKQSEIKKFMDNDELVDKNTQIIPLKSSEEIEYEITKIDSLIYEISDKENLINNFSNERLILLDKRVSKLLRSAQKFKSTLEEDSEETLKIELIFQEFYKIESLLNDLESYFNLILGEIDLNVSLTLSVSDNNDQFLIEPKIQRSTKKNLNFDELTTPEKVYFIISFCIVIQLIRGTKEIIFTNLFLPEKFNKKGSIFRTIKKLLNLVQNNKSLEEISLIFIIKNLEPKKLIPELNLIRIDERER